MKQYITIIAAAFLMTACGKEDKKEEATTNTEAKAEVLATDVLKLTDAQLKNMSLEMVEISNSDMPVTIRLNAKAEVAPQNTVSITNAFGGYVKRIGLIPGNYVTKGQVLVVLEDPQYIQTQEDYLTTKALLEQANADFVRQRDLNAAQAASNKVMEAAKANKQTLQVKKSALEQRLRLMNINPGSVSLGNIQRQISVTAPVSGMVSEVNVNMGQYASPANPMLEIINPDSALLNVRIFEKDLPQIEVGQAVKAFTNTQPDKKADAVITSISREVNEDGTVNVYAKITQNNGVKLAANMYFNIELQVANAKGLALPEEAVVNFEGKDYVFEQLSAKEFIMIAVQKGNTNIGMIGILTQLPAGKKYVTKGSYRLLTALKNSGE
ncbi:MAG: efflux RND transporter periplasmic adaptor subunit [Chryseobacterium sp.]|nr:efflux RND transporter periplasmic adaptor subunit [Candidatus Chryseobacterium enterohippi]